MKHNVPPGLLILALAVAACGGKTVLAEGDAGSSGEAGSGGTAGSGGGTSGTGGIGGSGGYGGGGDGGGGYGGGGYGGGGYGGGGYGGGGYGGGGYGGGGYGGGGDGGGGYGGGGYGGTAGYGGTGGATGGTGGGSACGQTWDFLELYADLYDGSSWGCWTGNMGTFEIDGVIIESYAEGFAIDSCAPNMDCAGPMISRFSYYAPGLETYMPWNAYVRVRVSVDTPWACVQHIQVKNLPEWGGALNPVSMGTELYLEAADGELATYQDSPFDIQSFGLGCYPGAPSCGEEPDDFVLQFLNKPNPGEPGTVMGLGMGEQGDMQLTHAGGTQYITFRNLRSFVSGACDDYWNWAYWAAPTVFLPD